MTERLTKPLPCGRPLPAVKKAKDTKKLFGELLAKLDAYVASKKLNHSEARSKILQVILDHGLHFRAQDLIDRLQQRFPEVGRATLYRNLPIFVESGLLQEGPTDPDGQALYELSDEDHHDHIVCLDCRRIFEFHDEAIEKRQDAVSSKLGFTPREHRHVIYGHCDFLKRAK